jgi:phosphatidyl-N-methylethanolamine N-methyltransferase
VGRTPSASVNPSLFLAAAAALTLERTSYVWIARAPASFRAFCSWPAVARLGEPVAVVEKMFYGFKVVQAAVFAAWCYGHGSLAPAAGGWALAAAAALVLAGQVLNVSVFYRLGRIGVFFGDRFGYRTPWCRSFPFSLLSHPQYVGAVMTIWGIFLAMRFPHADWSALPILETGTTWWGRSSSRAAEASGKQTRARSRFAPTSL